MKKNIEPTESSAQMQTIITDNIRLRYTLSGCDQYEFADALHISRSNVSQKLNGRVRWTLDDLANAAEFFSVSPADLLSTESIQSLLPNKIATTAPRYLINPEDRDATDSHRSQSQLHRQATRINGIKKCPHTDSNCEPTT
ncbi:helix-turn-helix domain-containing protein [Alloscardovia venturai]|uniref:Helix-turn-helix domain-containing protein n=1 Tax=Alloscardovia venturai TaxID=1769421 RepID=A0ABW2YAJ2_9BIFI